MAANTPVRLGIGKESVTSKPSATFPYVPAAVEEQDRLKETAEWAQPA